MALPKRSLMTRFVSNPYVAGALPTLGGFLFGADISSMSGMLSNPNYFELFNHPNSDLQGGITAAMPAGSFGGALLNSWLSDKIGRKKCIILSGYVWCIGCAIQAGAHNVATLVAGRVVAGIAVGIASAIVTVYQAEISKPSIRGRIVSIQQLAIMTGIMLQYFCTLGFSYIDSDVSFRAPWALQMIPGLLLGTLMWAFPESPRWLCDHGHWDAGLQVLADVHADGDTENEFVQQEFNEIRRQIEFDHTQAAKSYLDLVKPDVRLRVIIGCCTQIWSQLSGMMTQCHDVLHRLRLPVRRCQGSPRRAHRVIRPVRPRCPVHDPDRLLHRQDRAPSAPSRRLGPHGDLPPHRRRTQRRLRQGRRGRKRVGHDDVGYRGERRRAERHHRLLVPLRLLVRRDLGSRIMDVLQRAVPDQGPRQGCLVHDGVELDVQLCFGHDRPARVPQHPVEDVHHLRRLQPRVVHAGLHHVPRDEGLHARGDGGRVQQRERVHRLAREPDRRQSRTCGPRGEPRWSERRWPRREGREARGRARRALGALVARCRPTDRLSARRSLLSTPAACR